MSKERHFLHEGAEDGLRHLIRVAQPFCPLRRVDEMLSGVCLTASWAASTASSIHAGLSAINILDKNQRKPRLGQGVSSCIKTLNKLGHPFVFEEGFDHAALDASL